jgi:hypothetical protein
MHPGKSLYMPLAYAVCALRTFSLNAAAPPLLNAPKLLTVAVQPEVLAKAISTSTASLIW